ncbi:MAG TPA: glycoside hydrolase family 3 N-terminal domain-containing protein [Bryobacteraceae bacterium]|nr:glycoside hydrolase family 3 N-terminal domain-containing protein [Bryobacteraceae bacterium]
MRVLICFPLALALSVLLMPQAEVLPRHEFAPTPQMEQSIDELLKQMTLEEKIGQLVDESAGPLTGPGSEKTAGQEQRIKEGKIGSLLNVVGAERTNALQRIAVEQSRMHIPLLFGLDVIHGYRTIVPVPIGLASSWDTSLVEQTARMAAAESAAQGIRWVFSPMVDIARDARWGRIVEGAGEDPWLGSEMARAYVRGYQGTSLGDASSVAACVKHFAAYGAVGGGRDYNSVDLSERTLEEIYLPPYHAAIDAGAATVMSAFPSLNGVPVTANAHLLTQILRTDWGFQGFVVSDWGAVRELMAHGVALDEATAARKAFMAGVDVDMAGDIYGPQLAALVRSKAVPEQAIDRAVRRVLGVKFALGLFDHPYAPGGPDPISTSNRELAREVAEESLVLLKNANAVLPLSAARTIALIGPFADAPGQMLGSWTAEGRASDVVTLLEAMQERARMRGAQVIYAQGTDIQGQSRAGFADAVAAARRADVVVITLGEDAQTMTGEAASRAHLGLPGNQQQLLEAVTGTGKPVVLVLFNGHPLAIPWAAEHVAAIIEAWYLGIEAGPAVDAILFGDANPSGHLTVSMPRAAGQEPLFYNEDSTGRPAAGIDLNHPPTNSEEKYHSRYIDVANSPLFPFGYGLSYTKFSFSRPVLDRTSIPILDARTATVTVSVDIQNKGSRAGDEVAQLYLRLTGASVERPLRELKGFKRVHLEPDELRTVHFVLGFPELSFLNADLKRVMEPNTRYDIWVGDDSNATSHTSFTVQAITP